MPQRSQSFLWRKFAMTEWVAQNEDALDEATAGSHAMIERPNTDRLLIEAFCGTRARAAALKAAFGGSIRPLSDDWHERIFSAHRIPPLRIGKRLIVVSDDAEARGMATLVIPAGAAFGTGGHATTAMSLRMLERATRRLPGGWRMLDAGTGSGILALAAHRFGAREVLAIDNDPTAVATAGRNARLNGISEIRFLVRDVRKPIRGRFDIITANLFSELLISGLSAFGGAVASGGSLILSGVLRSQEPEVMTALRKRGFEAQEIRRRGKWIALRCRRGSGIGRVGKSLPERRS